MRSAAIGRSSILATVFAFVGVLACAPSQSVDRIDPETAAAQTPATPAVPTADGTLAPSSLPTGSADGGEIPTGAPDAGAAGMIDLGATPTPVTPVPADSMDGGVAPASTPPAIDAAPVVTTPDASAGVDLAPPAPAPDATAPDLAPPPARWAAIVMTNPLAPGPADQIVRRHVEARGLKVFWVPDFAIASDVSTASIVIITNGVRRFATFASFRDTAIPMVVMKASALDELDMTGANRSVDYDEEDADDLMILDDRHPLAAGLHGTLPFASSDATIGWGHPSATAARIAGLANLPAKFVIFAYDKGSTMLTRPAPARRIAMLIGDRLSDRGSTEANRLLDAALDWSLR